MARVLWDGTKIGESTQIQQEMIRSKQKVVCMLICGTISLMPITSNGLNHKLNSILKVIFYFSSNNTSFTQRIGINILKTIFEELFKTIDIIQNYRLNFNLISDSEFTN